jgi:hypothetical protein
MKNAPAAARPPVDLLPEAGPLSSSAVEMFTAIERGELAVRLLPEKGQQARLELENRTDWPLTVEMSAAIGGRPLAGVGVASSPGVGAAAGTQPLGGGMGGGFFCVPPERVGYLRITTACLDDSKPEPRPGMVYEVCRIEDLTTRPAVAKLCAMLGDQKTDRRAVQAGVWHVQCERSWAWLSGRLESCGGPRGTQKLFTLKQLETARRLTKGLDTSKVLTNSIGWHVGNGWHVPELAKGVAIKQTTPFASSGTCRPVSAVSCRFGPCPEVAMR